MYSTCRAMSPIRLANVPEPEPGGEARTRMRKPSEFSSMYLSSAIAAASNFYLVFSPSSSLVAMVRKRSTSRSTTTAYSPSFPPKCSYTTGLDTPARAATSSMDVPSRPRSANSLRPMSSSCSLRSLPVILFRLGPAGWLVTTPSWRPGGNSANRVGRVGRPAGGHRAEPAGAAGLLGGQPPRIGPADVVCPAELLGQPDAARRDVDLALEHAVPGAGRIGMVQVVPGLAEGQDRQPGDVP